MIYAPSEDTFLLAECVKNYWGSGALEIGVGTGLITKVLEQNFEFVAGSDIDLATLEFCKSRCGAMLACCDAASCFAPVPIFDLIVSNPPYLPDDEEDLDTAVHGGPTGIEATVHFIESALPLLLPSGKVLVVTSSLADSSPLERFIVGSKLHKNVMKEKSLFYEKLSVVELSR
ncbi:MAG: methyltransferase [Nitrososphaera sp.]|nr:methyltransferase [Nitrososphaera sp.]